MPNFRRIALSVTNHMQLEKPMQFRVFSNEQQFMRTYGLEGYTPRVDFDRYFLIAAHQGPCPTGGYGIAIEKVEKRCGDLVVQIRLREPKPDEAVTLIGTHPLDMVLVPKGLIGKQAGRRVFSFIDQRGNCLARKLVSTH